MSQQLLDQRTSERFRLRLHVKYLVDKKIESEGTVLDISSSGAAIISETQVYVGQETVFYFDGVGRLEGRIVRVFTGGFATVFNLTRSLRDTMETRLNAVRQGVSYLRLADDRRNLRVRYNIETKVYTSKSKEHATCRIIDISKSGCRLQTKLRPEINDNIRVGAMTGLVVRHTEDGIAMKFNKIEFHPEEAALRLSDKENL